MIRVIFLKTNQFIMSIKTRKILLVLSILFVICNIIFYLLKKENYFLIIALGAAISAYSFNKQINNSK